MSLSVELHHADCMDVLPGIPDNSIDLVLTDPPYGTTEMKWDMVIPFDRMWMELVRITKPGCMICLFGQEPFSSKLRLSRLDWWRYDWYWDKVKPLGFTNAKKAPLQQIEIVSCFSSRSESVRYFPLGLKSKFRAIKPRQQFKDRYQSSGLYKGHISEAVNFPRNIIKCSQPNTGHHPTQKPVALLKYLIETYTLEGETVLDFTMGSGSTGVAAKGTGRKFIGIELEEKYFDIAKRRIDA